MNDLTLLPPTSTPLEVALDVQEHRLLDIPVPLRELWDPWICPEHLLPHLAWGLSVDLWHDDWPIERKREICAESIALHRLKGTLGGVRKYLSYVDVDITRAILPPQAPYWAPLDQASIDNWEATLPEVRIYSRREPGTADGFYFDADFTDDEGAVSGAFYEEDRAPEDGGNRVVFVRDGAETVIDWLGEVHPTYGTHTELGLPGVAGNDELYLDDAFYGEKYWGSERDVHRNVVAMPPLAPEEIRAGWYRVTRDTPDYVDDDGDAVLGQLYYGDGILDDGPDNVFDGDYYAGNEAPWQVYRRWYLFSPDAEPGDPDGWSYYDDMRYGIAPKTAELWLDLDEHATIDESYDGLDQFYTATDLGRLWQAADAIDLSKALRDQVLIETELRRPVTFGDRRTFGSFTFGQYLPRAH